MKRLKFIIVFVLALLVCLSSTVYAHSGGTDSQGGHRSPTGYHYHHGRPAHQHINGVCLYDVFDVILASLPWVILFGWLAYLTICSKIEQWRERRKQRRRWRPRRRISAVVVVAIIGGLVAVFLIGAGIYDISHRNAEVDPLLIAAMLIIGAAVVAAVVVICVLKRSGNLADELHYIKTEIAKRERISKIASLLLARIQALKMEEEARKRQLEEIRNKEREQLKERYEGKSMREIIKIVPKNAEIGPDGLPRNKGASKHWGPDYTCYVCLFGSVYHRQNCRYVRAYIARPRHITQVADRRRCSICKPRRVPDLRWIEDYVSLKRIFEEYGVQVVDDVAVPEEE